MKVKLSGLVLIFAAVVCLGTKSYAEDDKNYDELTKPYDVNLEGEYYWERVYFYNNTGNNNEHKETRTFNKTIKTNYNSITKSVKAASMKLGIHTEAGCAIEIITAKVQQSLDIELSSSFEKTVEEKKEVIQSESIKREFRVGPNSVGEMFRLNFRGPGVNYGTGTFSTKQIPYDKIVIKCKVKDVPMLKKILVEYPAQLIDKPDDLITANDGSGDDINKGQGGANVFLVPVWTLSTTEAVTGLQIIIQSEANSKYQDLSKGAGGANRYIKLLKKKNSPTRIKKVGLLRGPGINARKNEFGYNECTIDINKGRGGDDLFLCWTTVTIMA